MEIKFLTLLSKESIDYKELLKEKLGLKKVKWYHTIYFIKTFKKLVSEIEVLRNLEPKKVEESKDCKIIRPDSVDNISFGARVELQTLFENPGKKEISELIIESISLCCYESHTKNLFDSDSTLYKEFKKLIEKEDLVQMLGLYNWIDKQYNNSVTKWNNLFTQVRVFDQDWDNAGGSMMDKFDILNTIKKSCLAFNLDYHRVLQMPYGLIKANALSDATRFFIQDKIRIIVESRMKTNREKPQ